jgi:hypothetical protein
MTRRIRAVDHHVAQIVLRLGKSLLRRLPIPDQRLCRVLRAGVADIVGNTEAVLCLRVSLFRGFAKPDDRLVRISLNAQCPGEDQAVLDLCNSIAPFGLRLQQFLRCLIIAPLVSGDTRCGIRLNGRRENQQEYETEQPSHDMTLPNGRLDCRGCTLKLARMRRHSGGGGACVTAQKETARRLLSAPFLS